MSHFKWSPLIGDLRNTNDARSRDLMAVTRVFFPSFLALSGGEEFFTFLLLLFYFIFYFLAFSPLYKYFYALS